ncbi:hypothetical protein V5799_019961 [Amblyomma americanum]|uniref:Uncharacterized protein n=1 Tax=Amblyomma americanum TaxID=6943 RepID=A0AAQ4EVE9_AMBAM
MSDGEIRSMWNGPEKLDPEQKAGGDRPVLTRKILIGWRTVLSPERRNLIGWREVTSPGQARLCEASTCKPWQVVYGKNSGRATVVSQAPLLTPGKGITASKAFASPTHNGRN